MLGSWELNRFQLCDSTKHHSGWVQSFHGMHYSIARIVSVELSREKRKNLKLPMIFNEFLISTDCLTGNTQSRSVEFQTETTVYVGPWQRKPHRRCRLLTLCDGVRICRRLTMGNKYNSISNSMLRSRRLKICSQQCRIGLQVCLVGHFRHGMDVFYGTSKHSHAHSGS